LLSDVLKQMQEQMAQQMQNKPGQNNKMCNKPGQNPKPGLGQLQKQLNQQMQQLMKSGKTGKELSEELAKLAAQQERIRKALSDLEQMQKQNGTHGAGSDLNELNKQMEETETDIVNKRITQETLLRQQEILTRLLEAEKSVRERELDENRESNTATQKPNEVPPSFEKYIKAKEKQVDLLKTIPPALTPYFKQEVNEYFQMIEK